MAKFWRVIKMKQIAVIKKFRIVQKPLMACLFQIPDAANLPFRPFVPIAEQIEALGDRANLSSAESTSDEMQEDANDVKETEETDPLLALAGTLKWDDISGPNTVSLPEIRVVKGPYEDHSDPLIALLGTLESDVTDIGERHDDYIGDALLPELWGDEDE